MKKIELTNEQAEELVKFYEANIDTLNRQKFEIEMEISKKKDLISNLSDSAVKKEVNERRLYTKLQSDAYEKKKMRRTKVPWRLAATLVLAKSNELLSSSEILSAIEKQIPVLTEGKERKSTMSSLSATLSIALEKNQISRFTFMDENFYGLNEWFMGGMPKRVFREKLNKRG